MLEMPNVLTQVFIFFCVGLIWVGCGKNENLPNPEQSYVVRSLAEISPEERKKLESFFDTLVKDYNYPYTLFGDKPCSFASYEHVRKAPSLHSLKNQEFYILDEGWNTWLRHQDLFPSTHYMMRKVSDSTLEMIIVINKIALQGVLRKHLDKFQQELGMPFSVEEIVKKVETEQGFFENLIDSPLLGILLGYGKVNTECFERRMQLCQRLSALPPPFELEGVTAKSQLFLRGYSKNFRGETEFENSENIPLKLGELNQLIAKCNFFELKGGDFFQEEILSPVFAAVKDEETDALQTKYEEARETIINAYRNKSVIEVTLTQWMRKD